jgi:hypothetical protein
MKNSPSPHTQALLRAALEDVRPFAQHALHGSHIRRSTQMQSTGLLSSQYAATLAEALQAHDVYVVFSYETPIIWLPLDGKDVWVYPDAEYTPTTRGHQDRVVAMIESIDGYTIRKV